jgi:hypothetical protein
MMDTSVVTTDGKNTKKKFGGTTASLFWNFLAKRLEKNISNIDECYDILGYSAV